MPRSHPALRAAEDSKGRFGDEAVNAVTKDFYVDDFGKSVGPVNEASSLANEVACLPSEAGFGSQEPSHRENVRNSVGCGERCLPV